MKKKSTVIVATLALLFAGGAHAQSQSENLDQQHKAAMEKCGGMSGNAKDICKAEADGQKKVGEAQAKASQRDTPKNRLELQEAKADAEYKVAKERCDDQVGDAKSACQKQAKASRDLAMAEAKKQSQTQASGSSGMSGSSAAGRPATPSSGASGASSGPSAAQGVTPAPVQSGQPAAPQQNQPQPAEQPK